MTTSDEQGVWVFNGDGGRFPSAVFSTLEIAEEWIKKNKVSGILTWYPIDVGVYEWVTVRDYWKPTKEYQLEAEFIQKFSSAYTGHYHYENGVNAGRELQSETTEPD